jgi:hypothetical protein
VRDHRVLIKPDAVDYDDMSRDQQVKFDFKDFSSIQVIVKLATIYLSPEKPSYPGGSWHIEGQLNEHIAATVRLVFT